MSAVWSNRWCPTAMFGLAAALSPVVAAWAIERLGDSVTRYEMLSVGTFAALGVGAFAGLQRGTLWALLSAPWFGFFIGSIDLRTFVWLYSSTDVSLGFAVLVPVWGTLFGVWVALHRRRWWSRILTVLVVAGVDLTARFAWDVFGPVDSAGALSDWRWAIESLIYSPTAMCIVLMTPRSIHAGSKNETAL